MSSPRKTQIAASILSAQAGRLSDEAARVVEAGSDWLHLDIMDGSFVPELTFGANIVSALRQEVQVPLDVHLMVNQPERHVQRFAEAGADIISVHAEASVHLHRTLSLIRALGKKAGVALNPHTPLSLIEYILEDCDLILLMTVNPGYGGQSFIKGVLPKIELARTWVDRRGLSVDIEVDGGIQPGIAKQVTSAGANVLVAGHAIFSAPNYQKAIEQLRHDAQV